MSAAVMKLPSSEVHVLGLFPLVTLMAYARWQGHEVWICRTAYRLV